jgi:hypothetical protein
VGVFIDGGRGCLGGQRWNEGLDLLRLNPERWSFKGEGPKSRSGQGGRHFKGPDDANIRSVSQKSTAPTATSSNRRGGAGTGLPGTGDPLNRRPSNREAAHIPLSTAVLIRSKPVTS